MQSISLHLIPRIITWWCNEIGVAYLSINFVFYSNTKHVEIGFHFVRNKLGQRDLMILFFFFKWSSIDKTLLKGYLQLLCDKLKKCEPPSVWVQGGSAHYNPRWLRTRLLVRIIFFFVYIHSLYRSKDSNVYK